MSDSAIPWTAARQAPPSMGSSRQEYWSGVPLPSRNSQGSLPQTICKIESQREFAEGRRELKPSDLCQARGVGWGKRWEGVSRGMQHVYLWLTHVHVWQKLTQYCKAIILQLKY